MGAEYNLSNYTKKEYINGYWKNGSPSIKEMMIYIHLLGWGKNDEIFSGGGLTLYEFINNKWIAHDVFEYAEKHKDDDYEPNNDESITYDGVALYNDFVDSEDICKNPNMINKHCKNCKFKSLSNNNKKKYLEDVISDSE